MKKVNKFPEEISMYNVGLVGSVGSGKTTLMKEVCETLVGRDGYLLLDVNGGADTVSGAVVEKISTFENQLDESGSKLSEYQDIDGVGFLDVVDDIVAHKDEYYPELKILVVDTMQHLIGMAESYVVNMYKQELEEKGESHRGVKFIEQTYGGFMRGQEKVMNHILDVQSRLNKVGVALWITGQVNRGNKTDVLTGEEYEIPEPRITKAYFHMLKSHLHFFGMLDINRGTENPKRVIRFDTDGYFSNIEPQIEYGADNFIKALQDAINEKNN